RASLSCLCCVALDTAGASIFSNFLISFSSSIVQRAQIMVMRLLRKRCSSKQFLELIDSSRKEGFDCTFLQAENLGDLLDRFPLKVAQSEDILVFRWKLADFRLDRQKISVLLKLSFGLQSFSLHALRINWLKPGLLHELIERNDGPPLSAKVHPNLICRDA